MSKVALDRVTSSFGFQAAFNNILQQIENEFSENVLYRKNPLGEPNSMSVDIDMGSHDLLNVGMVSATDFRINGETLTQSLQDTLEEVAAYPAEAKGYRDEALAYRDQAQEFASDASLSASDAAASAVLAEAAAVNAAADVATELSGYVTAASGFADAAEQSALDAEASVSGLDARVDALEISVPLIESNVSTLQTDKLDKDENINLGVAYPIVGNETVIDFGSDEDPIPAGVKRITVMFDGVSTNGASAFLMQLGCLGGLETTGYNGTGSNIGTSVATAGGITSGIVLMYSGVASGLYSGSVDINHLGGNKMAIRGSLATSSNTYVSACSKTLSGAIYRIRITTISQTDVFDAGTINISWEF